MLKRKEIVKFTRFGIVQFQHLFVVDAMFVLPRPHTALKKRRKRNSLLVSAIGKTKGTF